MSESETRRLVLGIRGGGGASNRSWATPAGRSTDAVDIRRYARQAQLAEQGKLDFYFLADGLGLNTDRLTGEAGGGLEPFTALSAIAALTARIGVIATVSTSFNHPYHVARRLASLDHISDGRAGWNIVTSGPGDGDRNFGIEKLPDAAERYARASEFLEVVEGLWSTWDADAVVFDKGGHRYADPEKIHAIDHVGEHFSVAGPLNIRRSPQVRPVYFQAGASPSGRRFAAGRSDFVYSIQIDQDAARAYRRELRELAAEQGRDPERVKLIPGISPILGTTPRLLAERIAEIRERTDYAVATAALERLFGDAQLADLDLDERVPEERLPVYTVLTPSSTWPATVASFAREPDHTLRDLLDYFTRAGGHASVAGSPVEVAQRIRDWFDSGAADGFNFLPAGYDGDIEEFVTQVVPILQEWGIAQTEYAPGTLRERLGLSIEDDALAGAASRSTPVLAAG